MTYSMTRIIDENEGSRLHSYELFNLFISPFIFPCISCNIFQYNFSWYEKVFVIYWTTETQDLLNPTWDRYRKTAIRGLQYFLVSRISASPFVRVFILPLGHVCLPQAVRIKVLIPICMDDIKVESNQRGEWDVPIIEALVSLSCLSDINSTPC